MITLIFFVYYMYYRCYQRSLNNMTLHPWFDIAGILSRETYCVLGLTRIRTSRICPHVLYALSSVQNWKAIYFQLLVLMEQRF